MYVCTVVSCSLMFSFTVNGIWFFLSTQCAVHCMCWCFPLTQSDDALHSPRPGKELTLWLYSLRRSMFLVFCYVFVSLMFYSMKCLSICSNLLFIFFVHFYFALLWNGGLVIRNTFWMVAIQTLLCQIQLQNVFWYEWGSLPAEIRIKADFSNSWCNKLLLD